MVKGDGQTEMFGENPTGPGLEVAVHRGAVASALAQETFGALRSEVSWEQDEITMVGKKTPLPRLTAWFGDSGLDYVYSGITMRPQPWIDELQSVRAIVEDLSRTRFNTVLLNLYRSGRDGVAWHADDEKDLGRHPVIGSLSLGATRKFQFRRRDDGSVKREIDVHDGDLVVMRGLTQDLWLHQVPKTSKQVGERINLTFRTIVR